jgi:hypothetical protein
MQVNVGRTDQLLRSLVGPALFLAGLGRLGGRQGQPLGLAAIIGGALVIESAMTRTCPLNAALGINTASRGGRQLRAGAPNVGRVPARARKETDAEAIPYDPQPRQEDQDARLRRLAEHGEREEIRRQKNSDMGASDSEDFYQQAEASEKHGSRPLESVRRSTESGIRPNPVNIPGDVYGQGDEGEIGVDRLAEAGIDRIVGAQEAGLGGGLDQAEEARLGKTDEEVEAQGV